MLWMSTRPVSATLPADRLRLLHALPPTTVAFGLSGASVRTIGTAPTGADRCVPVRCAPAVAVAWVHRAPGPAPLSSPWSSHRDLLGLRHAPWFDTSLLHACVQPHQVTPLIAPTPVPLPTLDALFRVAAECQGWLPGDRRSFATFVQLARAQGHGTTSLARALQLSPRRIRQLAQTPCPALPLARRALSAGAVSVPRPTRCTLRACAP